MANNTVNCTDEQLESFLEKSRPLVIQQYPAPDDVNSTAIGEIVRHYYKICNCVDTLALT